MRIERTDRKTVVFDEAGTQLGHVLKSGMQWVVKAQSKPFVSHEKSRAVAEVALGKLLGMELKPEPTRYEPRPKGS